MSSDAWTKRGRKRLSVVAFSVEIAKSENKNKESFSKFLLIVRESRLCLSSFQLKYLPSSRTPSRSVFAWQLCSKRMKIGNCKKKQEFGRNRYSLRRKYSSCNINAWLKTNLKCLRIRLWTDFQHRILDLWTTEPRTDMLNIRKWFQALTCAYKLSLEFISIKSMPKAYAKPTSFSLNTKLIKF